MPSVPDGFATARLRIGPDATTVTLGRTPPIVIGLGADRLARECFRHRPPTPYELEVAIARIEDALASTRERLPTGVALSTGDAALREIAHVGGGPVGALTRETVERVFNRLVDVAEGSPAGDLPDDPQWVAGLLILREIMHHCAVESVALART